MALKNKAQCCIDAQAKNNKHIKMERALAQKIIDLIAENKAKDELIFAFDAVRSPIIERTIINLQVENKKLKRKLKKSVCPHCGFGFEQVLKEG